MQQEEEAKTGTKSGSSSKPDDGQFNNSYEEDEELIDMDDLSESENET